MIYCVRCSGYGNNAFYPNDVNLTPSPASLKVLYIVPDGFVAAHLLHEFYRNPLPPPTPVVPHLQPPYGLPFAPFTRCVMLRSRAFYTPPTPCPIATAERFVGGWTVVTTTPVFDVVATTCWFITVWFCLPPPLLPARWFMVPIAIYFTCSALPTRVYCPVCVRAP